MLREIRLYGKLAEEVGQRVFHAAVRTPAEAVRFLIANFPRLEKLMVKGWYRVAAGRRILGSEESLKDPVSSREPIRIAPVMQGSGGIGRILAGVALVALSFVTGGIAAPLLLSVGAALTLGGVAQLLAPRPSTPEAREEEDPRESYSFDGVVNVSRAGVPVPVCYGRVVIGSIVVSAGIQVEDI